MKGEKIGIMSEEASKEAKYKFSGNAETLGVKYRKMQFGVECDMQSKER